MSEKEKKLSKIYHPLWKEFNENQYSQSTSLFSGRLEINGFDINWFKGKTCLDAGCGSGRYVQAMLDLGAKEVVGIDLDPSIAQEKIIDPRVRIMEGDIRKIPFENSYFDFVCCNGVLHHTENPKEIVQELKRVLKKNGYLFLYVFDKLSQDWELIDELRKVNKKFPVERIQKFLKQLLNLPENKIFNLCDLLYAPIQLKFTKEELNKLLIDFEIKYLTNPLTDYDRTEENRLIARRIN